MIKLLHIADVHIGMENYGRINPETGLNTRLHDFLDTLDEAVARAIEDEVDAVVVAGDVYKSRDPSPTHQREFARRILQLIRANIEVVLVPGNHDTPMAAGRATSLDIFRTLELPGVNVMRRISSMRITTRSGPLQIVALPWLVRSNFVADDERKNLPLAELLPTWQTWWTRPCKPSARRSIRTSPPCWSGMPTSSGRGWAPSGC